ncbi:MAG: DUF4136 domain-containing protein [Allosphingosinicella sp.]
MKTTFLKGAALALSAALAACATGTSDKAARTGGVEVGRFHLGQPIAHAQIAIEPFDRAEANRPEFAAYSAAVARQLSRLGWTVAGTVGQSEQVALIGVQQGSREAIAGRINARVGRGVAGLPLAGSSTGVTATLLEVAIRRRSDGTVFWEGRAVGEARTGTPEAAASAQVERLAEALFRDFPGESGRIIRVK